MAAMEADMTADDLRLSVAAALSWDPDARGGDRRHGRAGPREQRWRTCWPGAFGACGTARGTPAAIRAARFAVKEQRRARVAPLAFVIPAAPGVLCRACRA